MNILHLQIQNFIAQINQSDKKLEYLMYQERTRELYHNGNLHLQLRKATVEANKDRRLYYCSRCGELFYSSKERINHTLNHEERL